MEGGKLPIQLVVGRCMEVGGMRNGGEREKKAVRAPNLGL